MPTGSRQRVLTALRHRGPDCVPVDVGSTPSSGISAIAYFRLRKALAVQAGHIRVYDVVQQLVQPEEWFLNRLGIDVVDVGRTFNERDNPVHNILPDVPPENILAMFAAVAEFNGARGGLRTPEEGE